LAIVAILLIAVIFFYLLPATLLVLCILFTNQIQSAAHVELSLGRVFRSFRAPLLISLAPFSIAMILEVRFQIWSLASVALWFFVGQFGLIIGFVYRMLWRSIVIKSGETKPVFRFALASVLLIVALISTLFIALALGYGFS
jgi:hypothetical protein